MKENANSVGNLALGRKERIWILLQMIFVAALIFFSLFWQSTAQIQIASDSNSVIRLTARESIAVQAWQASGKNITGFIIPVDFEKSNNLSGNLVISLRKGSDVERILCQDILDIASFNKTNKMMASFKKTHLDLGERYYIELKLENATDNTILALRANTDYAGLTLDYKEVRGAIAGTVLYHIPGNLCWLLRIILIINGISLVVALLFNRSFEEVIGLSFALIFTYIYFWGCFEKLEFGVQSLYAVSMVAALIVPFLAKINGKRIKDIITPGMIGFWSLFIIYFVLDRNVVAGKVDDLNHWQLCVRDMWYFDSYPFHPGSTLIAMRYTPGFATIEYLFLYLYGTYREGIIMLACHTIGFAMLSILYSKVKWKQCHKIIPLTALIAGLPILVYQSHYGILYVDAYLGIIGAYLLICYFTEKSNLFNLLRITFGSILLIMTKEMGIVIAATIYLIIFLDIFINNRKIKFFLKDGNTCHYFVSGCIAVFSFISWQIYIAIVGSKYGLTNSFTNILKLFGKAQVPDEEKVHEILLASSAETMALQKAVEQTVEATQVISDASAWKTIKEMGNWLLRDSDFLGSTYVELTVIVILICAILGILGLYKKLEIPMTRIVIGLLAGTGVYTVALVVSYIYLFYESSAIPAARRYMGSYMLVFLITIIGIIIVKINACEEEENWKKPFIWIISLFILLHVPDNHPYYTTEENFGSYFTTWKYYQTIGEVFRSFADKDERVYYVEYSDSELVPQYNYLTFMNAIVPNRTQGLFAARKPIEESEGAPFNNYTQKYSCEDWRNVLKIDYSYVYLRYIDNYFIEHYGALFEDTSQIVNGGIYVVNKEENGKALLKQIAVKDLN